MSFTYERCCELYLKIKLCPDQRRKLASSTPPARLRYTKRETHRNAQRYAAILVQPYAASRYIDFIFDAEKAPTFFTPRSIEFKSSQPTRRRPSCSNWSRLESRAHQAPPAQQGVRCNRHITLTRRGAAQQGVLIRTPSLLVSAQVVLG